jgi:hypothetical protein
MPHLIASSAEALLGMALFVLCRTFPLFEAAWQAKQWLLPQPDVLIAAVGTRCYHYDRQTGVAL